MRHYDYRRALSVILVLVMLMTIVPAVSAQGGDVSVSPATARVNVRLGPGTTWRIRNVATPSDTMVATGRNDFNPNQLCTGNLDTDLAMWIRVTFLGREGWVARCSVNIVEGALADLPVVDVSGLQISGNVTVVTAEEAGATNVRSGPGREFTVLGVIYPDARLQVTGRTDFDPTRICTGFLGIDLDMWMRVSFNEIEGWVAFCAVDTTGDHASAPIVSAANPVLISEAPALVSPLTGTIVTPATLNSGWTRYESVMRADPDLSSAMIGTIPEMTVVWLTGRTAGSGWLRVLYQGYEGWVTGHLIDLAFGRLEDIPVVD